MIKEIFKEVEQPVWIIDKDKNIKFINNSFKTQFNIYEENNIDIEEEIKKNTELNDTIRSETYLNQKVYKIGNKKYKKVVFPYDKESEEVASMLVYISDVVDYEEEKYKEDILSTVIDNIPDLIFYKDKDLRYIGINKMGKSFYAQRGVTEVIGKRDVELPLDKEFTEACTKHDKIVLQTKKPLYIEEKTPMENSDEYQIFNTIKTPIINEHGDAVGVVGVVRDITEQKKVENRLRYLSYTDELTGLYNRSCFDEVVPKLIEDNKLPLGIITGDVNGLKIVNDTLGHLEGDKLLKSISYILNEATKDKDMIFRWGGDEFIIVLTESSDEECLEFIENVKKLCNECRENNFKVSIALGYSMYRYGDDIDYVLRDSENKAYTDKISTSKSVRTSMLDTLIKNLQIKNIETKEHTQRVYDNCLKLGKYLDLDEDTINQLLLVAEFHDIGKIGIPESILLKNGKLNEEEYEIIKTHSEKGYRLTLVLPELSHIARSILTHHERWDGKGYPLGLKGEDTPLVARIISVVDAYDAMTHNKVYKKAMTKEEAISEIRRCANTQFDPIIAEVFCNMMEKEN